MKTKIFTTDMDGSGIKFENDPFHSSWDAIGDALPRRLRNMWYRTRDFYYPQKELYSEWFASQVLLLKEIPVTTITDKIFPIPYSPGFLEFCRSLDSSIIKGMISSGVDLIANQVKEEAGLDFVICNKIHIKEGVFTGTGENIVGLWSKSKFLDDIMKRYDVKPEEICFVGDNVNDIDVLKVVGKPYVINPHPDVKDLGTEIKSYMEIKL